MSEKNLIKFFWIMLIVQVVPSLLLWDGAYIRIHDTLEGELNWYHMLKLSGTGLDLGRDTVVPQIMNGQPRITLHSPINITYWFMHIFGIYWGYLLQKTILIGVAFVGMMLLLKDEVNLKNKAVIMGIAVTYSWIPFYSVFGCSFAGIPLLIWAFLKVMRSSTKWYHFAIVLGFPFWSSIVWAAPSMLLLFLILTLRDWRNGAFKAMPWLLMVAVAFGYLLANLPLLSTMFFPPDGFVSHRDSYDLSKYIVFNFGSATFDTIYSIILGHYHVGTFFTGLIWLVVLMSIYLRKWETRYLIPAVLTISLFTGFYGLVILLFAKHLSLVETFRFDRLMMLLPFLYLVMFGLALSSLASSDRWKRTIKYLVVFQLFITVFLNDEFVHNIRHLTGLTTKPNYKTYFDNGLLGKVDDHIGKDKSTYRIIHLGMNPAISQHYGFYTLDGLQSVYSLDHKNKFEKIILNEFEKDYGLKTYFAYWGNRCYMFSSELGTQDYDYLFRKDSGKSVNELNVDSDAIRALGGEYVFSGLPILNAADLGWKLEGIFNTEQSYYSIYLYSL